MFQDHCTRERLQWGKGGTQIPASQRQWHHCLPGLADDSTREHFSLNVCVCVCVCVSLFGSYKEVFKEAHRQTPSLERWEQPWKVPQGSIVQGAG